MLCGLIYSCPLCTDPSQRGTSERHISRASRLFRGSKLFELFEVNLALHCTPIELQTASRLFITPSLSIYDRTVPTDDLVCRQRPCIKGVDKFICQRLFLHWRWQVFLTHQNVTHTLFEFANIARPRILSPKMLHDPRFNFLLLTHHPRLRQYDEK